MKWKTYYMRQKLHDWEIYSEAYREGFAEGFAKCLDEAAIEKAAIEFMRLQGISEESINDFRKSLMKS